MRFLIAGTAALAAAQPAAAQVLDKVTAKDPKAMVQLLDVAGFEPVLGTDKGGDPKIEIKTAGYSATIFFYGCDEKTHEGCDAVQFNTSFDRKDALPAKDALELARQWRYASVWLDKEGDPVVSWDVLTGDGIPSKVFLQAVRGFGDTLEEVADAIFPDDGSQDTTDN